MIPATTIALLHCTENSAGQKFAATKTWCPSLGSEPMCQSYGAGKYFRYQPFRVSDIRGFHRLLRRLEQRHDIFIIRGFLADGVDPSQNVRRMKRPDNKGRIWFVEGAGQPWVLLDIDKKPVPPEIDPVRDPKGAAQYLIDDCLPPYLRDVSFVVQWSSSTGMKSPGLLSAHLWYWLDRPLTAAQLKAWFHSEPWFAEQDTHVDPTLFDPIQIHYTAAPIFNGLTDPLKQRTGMGKREKDVASLPVPEQPQTSRSHRSRSSNRNANDASDMDYDILSSTHGFEAKLALIGDGPVGGVRLQGFHRVITSATASYVATHGKTFDRSALKEILRRAISAAPKRAGREGEIAQYLSDDCLDYTIASAIERFGDDAGTDSVFEDELIDGIPPAFP